MAFVITIIILLILAGVAISMITGGEGLFAKANDAATKYNQAAKNEADLLNQLLNGNYLNNGGNGQGEGPAINNDSHVGYYADLNPNDGKIDGIIFADLAVGGSGQWGDSYDAYTIPVKTGLKEYYESQESYTVEGFGTKGVLTPKAGSTGEDRFYIMGLENFGGTTEYTWYNAATNMTDYEEATSVEFGTGRANTDKMIEYWNNKTYGEQNTDGTYKDMWGEIQEKVAEGWFVPSRAEWAAFGGTFDITLKNYGNYGLGKKYWSSSQYSESYSNVVYFYYSTYTSSELFTNHGITYGDVDGISYVRLATTF